MSRIIIPYLNPIKFHKLEPDTVTGYLTKHMEQWDHRSSSPDWGVKPIYGQPFQTTDKITLQFQSSFAEDDQTFELINCHQRVFKTFTVTQGAESEDEAGLFLYEIDDELTGIDEGYYFIRVTATDDDEEIVLVSEPLHIKELHKYSVLFEYAHFTYKDGIFFQSGIELKLRVHGTLRYKQPASDDTLYTDQTVDPTTLDSVPYRIWELHIGGTTGIPSYLIDRINRLLGCNPFYIDGVAFAKTENKLEEITSDDPKYPLRAWTIDLQEAENPFAAEFSTDADEPETPPTQLTTPTLNLTVDSSSQITADWVDDVNADAFTLQRGTVNNRSVASTIYSGTNLEYISTLLQAGKQYHFWLRKEGSGAYSASEWDYATATTDAAEPTPTELTAPTLTLTANGHDEIIATWTSIANTFQYQFYINDTNSLDTATPVDQYIGTNTNYTVSGLSPNTTYYGWVRAVANTGYLDSDYGTDQETTDPFDPATATFDSVIDCSTDISDIAYGIKGTVEAMGTGKKLFFNRIIPQLGIGLVMRIQFGSSLEMRVDFTDDYLDQPFKYLHSDAVEYFGTFRSGFIPF